MSKRKTPSSYNNLNYDLCECLTELAGYENTVTKNLFKRNAYMNAATNLARHHTRIKSGDEAKQIQGIGEKIARRIDEFLQTGTLCELKSIRNDPTNVAIKSLMRVSGIGPVKAGSLIDEGITSIEELKKHPGRLNRHQIIGLRHLEDFEKKIPREEIEQIEKVIVRVIKKQDPEFKITICGSYRRGKLECGDIDTLVTHPNFTSDKVDKSQKNNVLKTIVTTLKSCGLLTETISLGETKFMGACRLDSEHPTRRLDIRFTPHDQYYCSVLYFTGSDQFNKRMRAHALEKRFTLNEYMLRPLENTGKHTKVIFRNF